MTKKHALQYFICNINFKSHNFQTESPFECVAPTYRGSTTLSFSTPCYALCLGQFEFKTLLTLSSAFSKRSKFFCTRPSNRLYLRIWHKQVFLDQEVFVFCKSSSHHLSGWVPRSSTKVFFQETPARYRTLAACQIEYLPQVSWCIEGCRVWERAAVPPAIHSVRTCGWHHHAKGRTLTL